MSTCTQGDNFASLVIEAERLGTTHLLRLLALNGVNRPSSVRSLGNDRISVICLEHGIHDRHRSTRVDDAALLRLWRDGRLNERFRPTDVSDRGSTLASSSTSAGRADIIVPRQTTSSKRCKLAVATAVASDPVRRKAALDSLNKDMWALTTIGPQQARWRTWCDIATSWDLDPLPLTDELVRCTAASFKEADYESPQLYYSEAKARHIDLTGLAPDARVNRTIKNCIRSILRGIAKGTAKASFLLENMPDSNAWRTESIIEAAPSTWNRAQRGQTVDPLAATLLASWFLCREIELAAARVHQLSFNEQFRTVTWLLPSSKTDTAANGVTRTHGCSCSSSSEQYRKLCPFHCARQHVKNLRSHFSHLPQGEFDVLPLFPDRDGCTVDKKDMIDGIRTVAAACGSELTYIDLRGRVRQLFGGHAPRVAGAQFLARHGVDFYIIQLVGRWASSAILRYIQQAPLAIQHRLAANISPPERTQAVPSAASASVPAIADLEEKGTTDVVQFQHLVDSLRAELRKTTVLATQDTEFFVINKNTSFVHRPDDLEHISPSAEWKAKGCKWRYGQLSYLRTKVLPNNPLLCPGCFGIKKARTCAAKSKPVPAIAPVQSSDDSSSDRSKSVESG